VSAASGWEGRLGRIFGPDTLELLAEFVRDQVDATIVERERERRWLSVADAADYLGMSEKGIRRRVERGTVAYTRHGSRILIDRRALDDELARQMRNRPNG
jgi:excisionase family DNA binding protein